MSKQKNIIEVYFWHQGKKHTLYAERNETLGHLLFRMKKHTDIVPDGVVRGVDINERTIPIELWDEYKLQHEDTMRFMKLQENIDAICDQLFNG